MVTPPLWFMNHQSFRVHHFQPTSGNAWTHPADLKSFINPKGEGRRGAYAPRVAMDDQGNAVIFWKQGVGNKNVIFKSERIDGQWRHPQSSDDAVTPTASIATDINDLCMSSNGDVLLLWTDFQDRRHSLYLSQYREGKWSHPGADDALVADPQQYQFVVFGSCAMADNAKVIAVWMERGDDAFTRLSFAENDNGQWGTPGSQLNVEDKPANSFVVSASAKGNFIISWVHSDGNDTKVYCSVYRTKKP
ncbi:MAG: hypothetical protein KKD63_00990 [Proteobacteria bacterium]|nr:hypothetical protein [Pseudomonadota bacterium]